MLEVVRLNKIFRQASKSNIILNAHRVNEGKKLEIVDDENRIIKAINKIIEEEKTNKNFKQKYNAKKAQSLNIDKQISITISTYLEVDGYIFPETVQIKDSGTKIADVKISNLQINPKIEM